MPVAEFIFSLFDTNLVGFLLRLTWLRRVWQCFVQLMRSCWQCWFWVQACEHCAFFFLAHYAVPLCSKNSLLCFHKVPLRSNFHLTKFNVSIHSCNKRNHVCQRMLWQRLADRAKMSLLNWYLCDTPSHAKIAVPLLNWLLQCSYVLFIWVNSRVVHRSTPAVIADASMETRLFYMRTLHIQDNCPKHSLSVDLQTYRFILHTFSL